LPVNSIYKIKKMPIIAIAVIIVLIIGNFFFYNGLYKKQINYITNLLDRQVQIAGLSVDNTDDGFESDLHQIILSEDIAQFFSNQELRTRTVDKMKLFFSKYADLITGIILYDNSKNEFTLKKDETGNNWLEQIFVLHVQGEIITREALIQENRNYEYYLPVVNNNVLIGNIVVTIDYQKYFSEIFTAFNLKDYQWQWVINDIGEVIYNNNEENLKYYQLQKITEGLAGGAVENIIHRADVNGRSREIISSYYSTQLLQRKFGLVFSSPTDKIQKYIIRNSLIMGFGTLLTFLLIMWSLWEYLKAQKSEIERLGASEKMLFKMIEEMPVGVVIHNKNREIIKANKKAAEQYSFSGEAEMTGKIFPETAVTDENNYFSKHLGGLFSPDQFVILRKDAGEIILFRTSIPVSFRGEDANMEILVDVTMMELARKQQAKASSAKSEFLARMSYEVRTPLNGIIGMTDILEKQSLTGEARDVLGLLRRSSEVLLNIINDILDFSKIESGKMILDEIPFNLREEIVYCYDLARSGLDEGHVSLNCNVDENVPDKVIGDPFRLRQILTNFINLSIESTGKGQINLKCCLKDSTDGTIRLGFELADTGKSFDKATLKKIFGDYINIESKVHQDDDTSGFGTILARQLVDLMGGEFSVESPFGLGGDQGKKINFSIVIYSNEKPEKNLHFDDILSFGQIKTLVITGCQTRDEEILGMLHKLGLTLTVTTFQKSTVNQIKSSLNYPHHRYHLIVILDDKEFNGFEAAEEIRENNLSQQFVIAIISSNDVRGNLLKCVTMGIDHYIVKPYEIKELYDAVKTGFPQVDKSAPEDEKEKVRRDLRILIVEDNKMNQKVIGTMLKSLGYSFDFADNGFEGFIQAKTRRYDVIFMDLIMPEMDGFESARKILEYDNTLLIAAFTADNMPDSKRKAELSGIKEFIPKPVRIDDLKKFFSRYFIRN
jgi:signal transduction histidine kinase/CheY-like chemotaxis protein